MADIERETGGVTGIALSAALGLGIGLVGGFLLCEFLCDPCAEPLWRAVRRPRGQACEGEEDLDGIERSVESAWQEDPDLRSASLTAEALGDGIVAVGGTVRNQMIRQLAGEVARGVPGAEVVVNRIYVRGGESGAAEPDFAPEAI